MTSADHRKISRKQFVGMGLSVAVLSAGVTPWVAKARTVNFGAATTGKLSAYCRGDGTDEALQIQKCFDENLFVEVDEPPAGVGYGIGSASAWKGITMRSGHEIYGPGAAPGKFLRVGRWKLDQILLRNQDHVAGNTGIKLRNILIDGRRGAVGEGIPTRAKDNNTTGVMFKVVDTAGEKLSNITLTDVEIRNWPGIAMRTFNAKHVDFQDSKISNPARGGFRFTGACYDVNLLRCVAEDVGESAFGLWASNVVLSDPDKDIIAGDMHDFLLTGCRSNTRNNAEFGSALMLWGAKRITARGCTFGPSKNDVIHINSDTSTSTEYVPKDILIERCKMRGGKANSFKILADYAQRITVRDSLMYRPAEYCVNVSPWGKRKLRAFRDIRIAGNTFVKPGRGYVKINKRIKGVVLRSNRRR
jgi:hypothetical protein